MKKFYEEIGELGEIVKKGENHLVLALDDALTDGLKIHVVVFKKESEIQLVIMPYVKRILLKQKRYQQIIDKLKQNKNEFGTLISVYEGAYEKDLKLVASKKII